MFISFSLTREIVVQLSGSAKFEIRYVTCCSPGGKLYYPAVVWRA